MTWREKQRNHIVTQTQQHNAKCPYCGADVPPAAQSCSACGKDWATLADIPKKRWLPDPSDSKSSWVREYGYGGELLFIIAGVAAFFLIPSQALGPHRDELARISKLQQVVGVTMTNRVRLEPLGKENIFVEFAGQEHRNRVFEINAADTNLSDSDVPTLIKAIMDFSYLESLDIRKTAISAQGLGTLKTALPKLRIDSDHQPHTDGP